MNQALALLLLVSVARAAPSVRDVCIDARRALSAPEPELLTERRATVARLGPYELARGKRTFSPGAAAGFPADLPVVSDEGAIVRVLDRWEGVRMVIGVQRDDLTPRIVDRALVYATAEAARGGSAGVERVELAGGSAVVEDVHAAGAVSVRWEGPISASGWVPDGAFGPIWRAAPFARPDVVADLRLVDVTGGDGPATVLLRDAPNGGVLATLDARAPVLVRARGPAENAWRPVEAVTDAVRAVGWVEAALARDAEVYDSGRERAEGTGSADGAGAAPAARRVHLPEGTWILPASGAAPFARTERAVDVVVVAEAGATLTLRLPSRWESLDARVVCPRRGPAPEGSRASIACTR
jgi:hypothetical protein